MTSVNELHQRYLAVKLQFLEEQRGHVYKAVDNYVNMVINAGKQWTESEEGHRAKYSEIFQRVERAVEFLFMTQTAISDVTRDETLEFSKMLAQHSTLETEIIGKLLSASSSSAATTECATAETCKSCVQTDKESARQTDITHNVPSEIWKRLEKAEKKLTEKHDQIQNLESELQSLKNELQKLSTCYDNKLQSLKNKIQKVITDQDRQDEITSRINEDLEKKLTVMGNETKSIKAVLIKNNSFMEALSSRTESLEKEKAHLLEQIRAKHETLENVLTKEERSEMAIKEIKERLVLAETGHTEFVENVQMQIKEVETSLQKVVVESATMSSRIATLGPDTAQVRQSPHTTAAYKWFGYSTGQRTSHHRPTYAELVQIERRSETLTPQVSPHTTSPDTALIREPHTAETKSLRPGVGNTANRWHPPNNQPSGWW